MLEPATPSSARRGRAISPGGTVPLSAEQHQEHHQHRPVAVPPARPAAPPSRRASPAGREGPPARRKMPGRDSRGEAGQAGRGGGCPPGVCTGCPAGCPVSGRCSRTGSDVPSRRARALHLPDAGGRLLLHLPQLFGGIVVVRHRLSPLSVMPGEAAQQRPQPASPFHRLERLHHPQDLDRLIHLRPPFRL